MAFNLGRRCRQSAAMAVAAVMVSVILVSCSGGGSAESPTTLSSSVASKTSRTPASPPPSSALESTSLASVKEPVPIYDGSMSGVWTGVMQESRSGAPAPYPIRVAIEQSSQTVFGWVEYPGTRCVGGWSGGLRSGAFVVDEIFSVEGCLEPVAPVRLQLTDAGLQVARNRVAGVATAMLTRETCSAICLVGGVGFNNDGQKLVGTAHLVAADVVGVWNGSYGCGPGGTSLRLTLTSSGDPQSGDLTGLFEFFPSDINPSTPSGSFKLTGTIEDDGGLLLEPGEWIQQPPDFFSIGLRANVSRSLPGSVTEFSGGIVGCTGFFSVKR